MNASVRSIFGSNVFGLAFDSKAIAMIGFVLLSLSVFAAPLNAQTADEPATIKVMSYNIHYGQGMDGKLDLARIAKIISDQDPDIVGLQEIGNEEMAKKIGELAGMEFVFGASKESPQQYGDAVLCKHPFKWVKNYSIPSASSSRYQAMGIDVDLSKITGKDTKVRFINTHFDWLRSIGSQEARLATVDVIERGFFEDSDLPAILTGDLNAGPQSPPLLKMLDKGWVLQSPKRNQETTKRRRRSRQIDYVLYRSKEQLKAIDVKFLDEPIASDHLPIIMTLEILK